MGWKPVYGADTAYKKLSVSAAPRPVTNAGKIYVRGNTIFQNDMGEGIHVVDITNPLTPARLSFIGLPGNTEMAVKGNFMYANNFDDIVVINISNVSQPVEVKRLKKAFGAYNAQRPYTWQAPKSGYYDCPRFYNDSVVIKWVADSVYRTCFIN